MKRLLAAVTFAALAAATPAHAGWSEPPGLCTREECAICVTPTAGPAAPRYCLF